MYPAEVETVLDELPQILESAVIGVPHPDMGEGVIAVVVAKQVDFSDEQQIIQAIMDRLARFKQPRRIYFVSQLPKNGMGKVQKTVLREKYAESFAAPAGH